MAEGAQVTFLHGVVGVAGVARDVARERVDVTKTGQSEALETLRFAALAQVGNAARHHPTPGPARSFPAAASTTIVPVIIGCKEQK